MIVIEGKDPQGNNVSMTVNGAEGINFSGVGNTEEYTVTIDTPAETVENDFLGARPKK